jgi:hypothetical protein
MKPNKPMKKSKTFTRADAADMYNYLIAEGFSKANIPETYGGLWDMSIENGFTPGPLFGTIPGEKKSKPISLSIYIVLSIVVSLFLIYLSN